MAEKKISLCREKTLPKNLRPLPQIPFGMASVGGVGIRIEQPTRFTLPGYRVQAGSCKSSGQRARLV